MAEEKKNKSHPGRPPVENKRKVRAFKATDDEWEEINRRAKELGLKTGEYIRYSTLLIQNDAWKKIKLKAKKANMTVSDLLKILTLIE